MDKRQTLYFLHHPIYIRKIPVKIPKNTCQYLLIHLLNFTDIFRDLPTKWMFIFGCIYLYIPVLFCI